jgi:hypothetical protein
MSPCVSIQRHDDISFVNIGHGHVRPHLAATILRVSISLAESIGDFLFVRQTEWQST